MVSVALAACNGEEYLKQQLDSILSQTFPVDEIVVSLDESKDNSLDVLNRYRKISNKLKIFNGPSNGIVKNFENAIVKCHGDIIFLCDQDDVWDSKKVELVLNEFNKKNKIKLVVHDALITDENLNVFCESFFRKNRSRKGRLKNIIKNSYIGCCMAFKSVLKNCILPFPKNIPMHDQWIGLMAEFRGGVEFLNVPLIKYRRHNNNATNDSRSALFQMIKWRYNLVKSLFFTPKSQ